MKHVHFAIFCGVAMALACVHAGVITSVDCSVDGVVGCDVPSLFPTGVGGGLALSGGSINGGQMAQYNYCCADPTAPPFSVDVSLFTSDTETYHSGGPPRMGIAEILFVGTGCCAPDQGARSTAAAVSESGRTLNVGCTATDFGGCSNGLPNPNMPLPIFDLPRPYPFELGVPFQVSMGAQIVAALNTGLLPNGSANADVTTKLTIQVFEADGTTPVAILPTPEPASVALVGLGISVVVLYRKRFA